jgi:D-alanyl-D-alanine dipeptidase
MMTPSHDEAQKRAYWAEQLDEAHDFMMRVLEVRIRDCGEPLVSLRDAAADAGVKVQFSDAPFAHKFVRQFYLRQGLIVPFIAAARDMNDRGWVMKVEDAYRTPEMQKALQRTPELFDLLLKTLLWETAGRVPGTDFIFRRLLSMIAFCPITGTHISGSALDISVMDRNSSIEIDRGAPYPTFTAITPMDSPYAAPLARENRRSITVIMRRHGFIEYPWEFWHYNQQDAYHQILSGNRSLARYAPVVWDEAASRVSPVDDPYQRLNSEREIEEAVRESLQRLGIDRNDP